MKIYNKPEFNVTEVEDIITTSTTASNVLNDAVVSEGGEAVEYQGTQMIDVADLFKNAQ